MNTKRILPLVLAATLILSLASVSQAASGPMETIRQAVDQIITVLQSSRPRAEKKEKVKKAVLDIFAPRELSKRAVGRPWLDFTEAQRKEFSDLFITLLEETYLDRIEEYDNEQVRYDKEMIKDDRAMVLTTVVSGKKETPVNYRMIKLEDGWKVYDLVAEGVSLVKNYREQFQSLTANEDAEAVPGILLKAMRDKIKTVRKNNQEGDSGQSGA